jgi:hypothetical protein
LSQARLTTSHLVLPNSGSFILEHLLAAPELHLAGAWNSGPPPLILNPQNTTGCVPTTELFLFSHRTPDASCGHTVLLCRSQRHNITNYAYFDATYTDTFASTYLPNSSWPTVLASITQNCHDPIVEIIESPHSSRQMHLREVPSLIQSL